MGCLLTRRRIKLGSCEGWTWTLSRNVVGFVWERQRRVGQTEPLSHAAVPFIYLQTQPCLHFTLAHTCSPRLTNASLAPPPRPDAAGSSVPGMTAGQPRSPLLLTSASSGTSARTSSPSLLQVSRKTEGGPKTWCGVDEPGQRKWDMLSTAPMICLRGLGVRWCGCDSLQSGHTATYGDVELAEEGDALPGVEEGDRLRG